MASPTFPIMIFTSFSMTVLRSSCVLAIFLCSTFSQAQELPSIADTVAGSSKMGGYFNLYWDDSSGKMYWEIDKLDTEFLYQVSMGSGLGSNPVGIDRGQLRGTFVLSAKRGGA